MKIFKKIILILFLLIVLIYVTNITSIPDTIILFNGEKVDLATAFGIFINEERGTDNKAIQTSSQIKNIDTVGTKTLHLSLFHFINLKDIRINTIPKTTVIPLGNSVGLKLYTSGVLVVGMTEIEGRQPYKNTGIEEGDMIVEIDNKQVSNTEELINCVNNSKGGDLNIKYIRNGVEYVSNIEPIKTKKNEYKLGLWVRDGAAGIGTISYYEPRTKQFAALGHGIIDIDTEKLINISSGELVTANITSIVKGKEKVPGEIKGSIINNKTIGNVNLNTEFGIYGNLLDASSLNISDYNEIEVANRDEIKLGKAKVLLNLENGLRKEYDIEITKMYKNNNSNNKNMLVKVIDNELLELTGGIVQRNEWCTNNTKQ